MFVDRKYRLLRHWSNKQIRQLAPFIGGDVVNISGWDDRDKEGGHYKDYFRKAKSYTVTNYSGERGFTGMDNEIPLDLTQNLPRELTGKFDACFSHTTLEHIFDVRKAFSTICDMSRDIVFVIVPFSQEEHETESFKDYWRFTPSCLRHLFDENGLKVIYEAQSPYRDAGIYLLFIGSRNPKRWHNILPEFEPVRDAGSWIGDNLRSKIISFISKIKSLLIRKSGFIE